MYKTIQTRSNYRIEKIGPNGAIGVGSKSNGNVDVLLKNGNLGQLPFGGFLAGENIIGLQKVKVMYVRALCVDDLAEDVRYVIPNQHYVVGAYLDSHIHLLLWDGEVKHYLPKSADTDGNKNVVSLI